MVKTAAVVLQFGIKTKMKTQSFGSSSWVKLLLEAFQRKRSLRICTKFAQMRQVAMWHIFCMRLIYYSPNNFKILPDPYPYQLLNTSVRNCFGMIQSVSTSAQVPSFQSVYLNWSQTKFAASNAGRHGKQSKSNCKTRNRRVSIPIIIIYELHWAHCIGLPQRTSDDFVQTDELQVTSIRILQYILSIWRIHEVLDTLWSYISIFYSRYNFEYPPCVLLLIMSVCPKSVSHVWPDELWHSSTWRSWTSGELAISISTLWPPLSPGSSLPALLGPPETTNMIRGVAMWMPGGNFDANNMQMQHVQKTSSNVTANGGGPLEPSTRWAQSRSP